MMGTPAQLYGESIFTSFRSIDGHVPFYNEHLERLYCDTNDYFFAGRLTKSHFMNYFAKSIKDKNYYKDFSSHYHRLVISASKRDELLPRNFSLSDLELRLTSKNLCIDQSELRLKVFQSPFSENYPTVKAGSYFHNFYFRRKAYTQGFDDCLFTRDECITEASTSNIIFLKDNEFYTPNMQGVFFGITIKAFNQFLMSQNKKLNFQKISQNSLVSFDSAFLLNSVKWLTPIKQIDQGQFNTSKLQDINQQFIEYMRAQV